MHPKRSKRLTFRAIFPTLRRVILLRKGKMGYIVIYFHDDFLQNVVFSAFAQSHLFSF
jgi:hypothetical protein